MNITWVLYKVPQGSINFNKFCSQLPTQSDTLIKSSSTNASAEFIRKLGSHDKEKIHNLHLLDSDVVYWISDNFKGKSVQLAFE